jgi:stage II sporulation protein D
MRKPTGTWIMAGLALLFVVGLWCLPRQRVVRSKLALQPPPGVARLPAIRVALTSDAVTTAAVGVDGPFRVTPLGSQQLLFRQDRIAKSAVTLTATGFRWGTRTLAIPRIEIIPDGDGAVWVGTHEYRGRVQLVRQPGGRMRVVNVVPLEDYIAGVIDSEMPREFGFEARKSQAIVARSYALAQMQVASRTALFDLYATTRSQKYNGRRYQADDGRLLAGDSLESRQIAYETAGMVCTYQGKLFCTYYSAVCGGSTSLGSDFFADAAPPHRSVSCTWCSESPLYRWQATLTNTELQTRIQKYWSGEGVRFGTLKSIVVGAVPHAGGVSEIQMSDGKQTVTLPATAFRHGHGAGLCQWGARGLARTGKNYLQILANYYPGSQVVVLADQ